MLMAGMLRRARGREVRGIDAEPPHAAADFGPFLGQETAALGFAQPRARSGGNEHADAALDDDQPFILETLIGFGDGQRIGLFLRGQRADRGQGVAVGILAGEDRVGDRLAQPDVHRLFVLLSKRHAVVIQRIARSFNPLIELSQIRRSPRSAHGRKRRALAILELARGVADEDEAGDPLTSSAEGGPHALGISAPAGHPSRDIADAWAASSRFMPAAPQDSSCSHTGILWFCTGAEISTTSCPA